MSIAITIVIFIGVLFFLVTCHELGHFIASKKAGVQVEEFGIGYRLGVFVSSIGEKDPTRLLAIKRGGTVYSLNLLPLGAFVKTAGDDDPTVPGGLAGKGPWARLGVFAAGPIVNIFLAFLFISAYFMVPTKAVQGDGAMVHSVAEDSPAANAGMEPGDIILKIDESDIPDWAALQDAMNSNGETEKTLLIERAGETLQIELKPAFNSDLQRYTIGVLLCWGMVTKVEEGSPAEEAGIQPEDTILSINNKAVYDEKSLVEAANSGKQGEKVDVVLLRADEAVTKQLEVGPDLGVDTRWVSGTTLKSQRLSIWQSLYRSGDVVVHIPYLIKESIPLIKEDPSMAATGPIGAGQLTVEAVKAYGFSHILWLAGLISMGLALFNFLPIPPLDGGGMLIAFIEGCRRGKRLSARALGFVYTMGTVFMFALFVVIFYSDISRLIQGKSFPGL